MFQIVVIAVFQVECSIAGAAFAAPGHDPVASLTFDTTELKLTGTCNHQLWLRYVHNIYTSHMTLSIVTMQYSQ